jgi:hypothetical protein
MFFALVLGVGDAFGIRALRKSSSIGNSLSISEVFNLSDGDPPEKIYRVYRPPWSPADRIIEGELEAPAYRAKYHSRSTELRLECEKRGISTDGNKQELRNKIIATMPYWKKKIADLSNKPLILLDVDGVIKNE